MSEPKGFYQPFFTPAEKRDLELPQPAPLTDEIKLVRVAMRRMLKISSRQPEEQQVKSLVLLSAVSSRLAALVRTQSQISQGRTGGDNELVAMMENILAEAQESWTL